ncbi:unnamed protein product [Didymodactylos carnosus]|uniref:Uncharacterized protein n=1 Tax=Didymodactylos carnosus TaxID=1234261 RepID=A0A813ULY3_9BILA|nr:unnamed protein product [Didymodactylos carnosus]CAF3615547.1 unnamed protein product [Didymodactylos carnosus]
MLFIQLCLLLMVAQISCRVFNASRSVSLRAEAELCNKTNGAEKLRNMKFSHKIVVDGTKAEFSFEINDTYTRDDLLMEHYYFSTTFVEKNRYECRSNSSKIKANGSLNMTGLAEKGNYIVCVIFVNGPYSLASSQFCDVVSVAENCVLKPEEHKYSNQYVYLLAIFFVILFAIVIIGTCIRDYIKRPKTIEQLLETLPEHHADKLKELISMESNDDADPRTSQSRELSIISLEVDNESDDVDPIDKQRRSRGRRNESVDSINFGYGRTSESITLGVDIKPDDADEINKRRRSRGRRNESTNAINFGYDNNEQLSNNYNNRLSKSYASIIEESEIDS